MESFVAWYGEVPARAKRVGDSAARMHAAPWIRLSDARGTTTACVIGFQAEQNWWTLFFDRIQALGVGDAEVWRVESYGSTGQSWVDLFYYFPDESRWEHAKYLHTYDELDSGDTAVPVGPGEPQ